MSSTLCGQKLVGTSTHPYELAEHLIPGFIPRGMQSVLQLIPEEFSEVDFRRSGGAGTNQVFVELALRSATAPGLFFLHLREVVKLQHTKTSWTIVRFNLCDTSLGKNGTLAWWWWGVHIRLALNGRRWWWHESMTTACVRIGATPWLSLPPCWLCEPRHELLQLYRTESNCAGDPSSPEKKAIVLSGTMLLMMNTQYTVVSFKQEACFWGTDALISHPSRLLSRKAVCCKVKCVPSLKNK